MLIHLLIYRAIYLFRKKSNHKHQHEPILVPSNGLNESFNIEQDLMFTQRDTRSRIYQHLIT